MGFFFLFFFVLFVDISIHHKASLQNAIFSESSISYLCSMGNRRSSHSSLEEDPNRKVSHSGSNVPAKPKQPTDKHSFNAKSESPSTPNNPGPAIADTPSPRKEPPDRPPPIAKSQLPDLSKFPEDVRKLLLGHTPGVKMKRKANVVRIYISSIQDGKWFPH